MQRLERSNAGDAVFQTFGRLKLTCSLPPELKFALQRYKRCMVETGGKNDLRDCVGDLDTEMEEAGASFLGAGAFRRVWKYTPKCVVKVARDPYGADSNRIEYHSWHDLPPGARRHFLRIDEHEPDGWWVTQPLADEAGYTRDKKERISARLRSSLKKERVFCPDLRAWNVGTYRGRPVIIDYGMGVRCRAVRDHDRQA